MKTLNLHILRRFAGSAALLAILLFSSLTAKGQVTITTNTLANGIVGTSYEQTLTATSTERIATTWSIAHGVLPAGLKLGAKGNVGVISGTPTTAGASTVTIKATAGLLSDSKTFTITIVAQGRWATPADFASCSFNRFQLADGSVLQAPIAEYLNGNSTDSKTYSTFTVKQVDYVKNGDIGGTAATNNILSHAATGGPATFTGISNGAISKFYGCAPFNGDSVIPLFVLASPEKDYKVLSVSRMNDLITQTQQSGGFTNKLELRDYGKYYSWNAGKSKYELHTAPQGAIDTYNDQQWDMYTSLQEFAIWIDADGNMTLYPAASYFWKYGEDKKTQTDNILPNSVLIYNDIKVQFNASISASDNKSWGVQIGWWNGHLTTGSNVPGYVGTIPSDIQTISDYTPYVYGKTCNESSIVWLIGSPNAADVTATLDASGTLTISGKGKMQDFTYNAPWYGGRDDITSLVIQSGVTSIGNSAFYWCSGLTSLAIPNSVTSIGNYAFYWCSGLTSITCYNPDPSKITLGTTVFDGVNKSACTLKVPFFCKALYEAAPQWKDFTNKVESVPAVWNIGSPNAEDVTATLDANGKMTISGTGKMQDFADQFSIPWYDVRSSITSLVIQSGVTNIGDYAFYYCSNIIGNLTIPNTVTSIGNYAFWYCSGFTGTLTISNLVTSIGNDAFVRCNFKGALTIPNLVTIIGNYAFNRCSGLTSLTIPSSVTSIGEYAFQSCTGLTSLTIPNLVTSIGGYTFYSCSGLTTLNYNATNCTSVGSGVFDACPNLTALNIGNNVQTIPDNAFASCTNLTSVTNNRAAPQTINDNVFAAAAYAHATLYVPDASYTAYLLAAGWKKFNQIKNATGIENVSQATALKAWVANGTLHLSGLTAGKQWSVYNIAGVLVASPCPSKGGEEVTTPLPGHGVYIVQSENRTVKVMSGP